MCEWDDATRVRALREKISPKLREMVNCQVDTPDRDNFSEWARVIQELACNLEGEKHLRKVNNGRNNANGNPPGYGEPMDIDAIKLAVTKLHPAEYERRMNEGLCLHCGQAGHIMRSCKNAPRTRGNRGRGGGRGGNQGQHHGSGDGNQQQGGNQGQQNRGTGNQGYGYPQQTPTSFGGYNGSRQQFGNYFGQGQNGYPGAQQMRYVAVPNPGFATEIPSGSDDYSQASGNGPRVSWDLPEDHHTGSEKRLTSARSRAWRYQHHREEDGPLDQRAYLLDNLVVSAVGSSAKSILLSSYVVFGERPIPCVSLVDSGCTGLAFMDFHFAVRPRLPLQQLQQAKPLFLADGVLSSWITHITELPLRIGDHWERLAFFITTLAKDNPIILGLPWLSRHNPAVDWDKLRLTFRGRCVGSCLPYDVGEQEAPCATAAPSRYRQPTVDEVEDEGEPDWETDRERPVGRRRL
jgi:hypothetical protein